MEMQVTIPKLKNCPGKWTRFPPVEAEPADWIENGLKMLGRADSIFLLDFSGYPIDFRAKVPTGFLLLRELRGSYKHQDKVLKSFLDKERYRLIRICEVMNKMDTKLDVVFTPINYSVSDFQSRPNLRNLIYISNLAFDGHEFSYDNMELFSVNELENKIKELRRGYSFPRVKPLKLARTDLECYLSQTHNPWPGDLDGILWNSKRKRIISLLEYKTHNLNTQIRNEASTNYGNEDYRRFNVLRMLRDYINEKQASEVSILFIVWGSDPRNPHHSKIKIEKVDSPEWILLPRPIETKPETIKPFIEQIMDMI